MAEGQDHAVLFRKSIFHRESISVYIVLPNDCDFLSVNQVVDGLHEFPCMKVSSLKYFMSWANWPIDKSRSTWRSLINKGYTYRGMYNTSRETFSFIENDFNAKRKSDEST